MESPENGIAALKRIADLAASNNASYVIVGLMNQTARAALDRMEAEAAERSKWPSARLVAENERLIAWMRANGHNTAADRLSAEEKQAAPALVSTKTTPATKCACPAQKALEEIVNPRAELAELAVARRALSDALLMLDDVRCTLLESYLKNPDLLILHALYGRITNPKPSHDGPCGPESGCDGVCMEIAAIDEQAHPRKVVRD